MFEADQLPENKILQIGLGLASLAELQKPMLEKLDFDNTSTETLSRYGLALIIEVAEFLNECPWKSWKKNPTRPADLDRIKEEFVDLLSFIGSWVTFLNLLGISTADLTLAYQRKLQENNSRFGVASNEN